MHRPVRLEINKLLAQDTVPPFAGSGFRDWVGIWGRQNKCGETNASVNHRYVKTVDLMRFGLGAKTTALGWKNITFLDWKNVAHETGLQKFSLFWRLGW